MAESKVYDEESEAVKETATSDLHLFYEVTNEIRRIMSEISKQKNEKSAKSKQNLNELRIQGSLHFLTLKKINRLSQMRCKKIKDSTVLHKQRLESNNLKLQNLQYEISHLEKEVARCLQFRSKHEDIEMVPTDEFYEQAPKVVSNPDETKQDVHKQTLARLDWELTQRQILEKDLTETQKVKENVASQIEKREKNLQSLKPSLDNILKSTLPLQSALGNNFSESKNLKAKAMLLPDPLYVIFLQASAFGNAFDSKVRVTIEGDVTEAENIARTEQEKLKHTEVEIMEVKEDSDSENEEEESELRKRRSSHATEEQNIEVVKEDVLKLHPFKVVIISKLEDGKDDEITMKFSYLVNLDFVTVGVSLNLPSLDANVVSNNVLNPKILLSSMLEDSDTGLEIPNAVEVAYKVKVNVRTAFKGGERPYMWAQKLAGFDFLCEAKGKGSMAISFTNMRKTLQHIQRHVKARIFFAKELNRLEKHEANTTITSGIPPKVNSNLTLWTPILYHEYCEMDYTKTVVELGLVSNSDRFYSAKVQRLSASVDIAISIPSQYPKKPPILALCLNWRGVKTSENDLNVRKMQADVNHFWITKHNIKTDILSGQIHRVMVLLDLYLESASTESELSLPVEFPTEKLCPRQCKGRAREKPFNYNHSFKLLQH